MPATRTAQLTFEDGQVRVVPQDRDIFFLSAEKAIEACRDTVRAEERIERFESEFLIPLNEWCVAHADRVAACYVATPASLLRVFVVTNAKRYDFDLGDELAALERQFWAAGWRVGMMQLPGFDTDSLGAFFNPAGALNVYAQPGSAPQEGGK